MTSRKGRYLTDGTSDSKTAQPTASSSFRKGRACKVLMIEQKVCINSAVAHKPPEDSSLSQKPQRTSPTKQLDETTSIPIRPSSPIGSNSTRTSSLRMQRTMAASGAEKMSKQAKNLSILESQVIDHLLPCFTSPMTKSFGEKQNRQLTRMTQEEYGSLLSKLKSKHELESHCFHLFDLLKKYRNLFSVTSSISVGMDSGESLLEIIEGTYEILQVERVTFFLIDHGNNCLNMCVSKDIEGCSIPLNSGIVGYVATHNESVLVNDVYQDDRFDCTIDVQTGFKTKSVLCVPIRSPSNSPVAVVEVVNKLGEGEFQQVDQVLLELIALIAGHSLYKLELYESAMLAGRKSSAMLDAVRSISTEEQRDIPEKIVNVVQVALSCEVCVLYVKDSIKHEIICYPKVHDALSSGAGAESLVARVMENGQGCKIDDCQKDNRFDSAVDEKPNLNTISTIVLPVHSSRGEVIAAIQAINKQDDQSNAVTSFSDQDVVILTALCEEIGLSLKRSYLDLTCSEAFRDLTAIRKRDPVKSVVSSLLRVHSNRRCYAESSTRLRLPRKHVFFEAIDKLSRPIKDKHKVPSRPNSRGLYSQNRICIDPETFLEWQEASNNFAAFDFNPFIREVPETVYLVVETLSKTLAIGIATVSPEIFEPFVKKVQESYRDVPYHSWVHGFAVFQHVFAVISHTTIASNFSPIETFGMLIATLCHDIDHPGHDNSFEIATESELALCYNDMAVLEQHHAATTFRLLKEEGSMIVEQLTRSSYIELRKLVVDGILATDMQRHFEIVSDLGKFLLKTNDKSVGSKTTYDDVKLLVGSVMHACDIGTQLYPTDIALEWGSRIVNEFKMQSELELERGLSVPAFRANLDTNKDIGALQLNFIDYIVAPLWSIIFEAFPELTKMRECLDTNRTVYLQWKTKGGTSKVSTPEPRVVKKEETSAAAPIESTSSKEEASETRPVDTVASN